jgi:hypothetical protein
MPLGSGRIREADRVVDVAERCRKDLERVGSTVHAGVDRCTALELQRLGRIAEIIESFCDDRSLEDEPGLSDRLTKDKRARASLHWNASANPRMDDCAANHSLRIRTDAAHRAARILVDLFKRSSYTSAKEVKSGSETAKSNVRGVFKELKESEAYSFVSEIELAEKTHVIAIAWRLVRELTGSPKAEQIDQVQKLDAIEGLEPHVVQSAIKTALAELADRELSKLEAAPTVATLGGVAAVENLVRTLDDGSSAKERILHRIVGLKARIETENSARADEIVHGFSVWLRQGQRLSAIKSETIKRTAAINGLTDLEEARRTELRKRLDLLSFPAMGRAVIASSSSVESNSPPDK